MRVISLGVHVLDVLVCPVEVIPEGQGGQLVDSIRITAAGLGSDHGAFDLTAVEAFAAQTPTRSTVAS